jgi:hypothetical protein
VEGKFIYLIFLAVYFYLQYRAAQKKKQREQENQPDGSKPKSERGKGFRALEDILKEAQKQIQEAQHKKTAAEQQPKDSTKKEKSFSSTSYKSIADKHNKSKAVYTPLTVSESFSGIEGESVFTQKELDDSHIYDVKETIIASKYTLDLRQAVIADAILNKPYE